MGRAIHAEFFQNVYEDVRDNLPAYLVQAAYFGATWPLSYARAARIAGSAVFWGVRATAYARDHPESTRAMLRESGNAIQDIAFQSPYMKPIWRN